MSLIKMGKSLFWQFSFAISNCHLHGGGSARRKQSWNQENKRNHQSIKNLSFITFTVSLAGSTGASGGETRAMKVKTLILHFASRMVFVPCSAFVLLRCQLPPPMMDNWRWFFRYIFFWGWQIYFSWLLVFIHVFFVKFEPERRNHQELLQ